MSQQDVQSPIVFLGCYLKRLSSSLGFGTNPTTVDLELVAGSPLVDFDVSRKATGFIHSSGRPGSLLRIKVGEFDFVGFVQSWTENWGQNGRTYNVKMADPRALLENVPVVYGDGVTALNAPSQKNVIDVFRHYGNLRDLGVSPNGTMFHRVKDYIKASGEIDLFNNRLGFIFGTGFTEGTGLSGIGIPPWYKLKGNINSFNQICQQAATDFGFDYYMYIDPTTYDATSGSLNYIKIETIDRKNAVSGIDIDFFISGATSSGTLISYQRGQELRTDAIVDVLNGAPATLWVGCNSAGSNPGIFSYWGRTADGSALYDYVGTSSANYLKEGIVLLDNIYGSGVDTIFNHSSFQIDYTQHTLTRTDTPNTYPPALTLSTTTATTTGYRPKEVVMRAALYSQPAWEAMMFKYHETIAKRIGIKSQVFRNVTLFNNIVNTTPEILNALSLSLLDPSGLRERDPWTEALISTVYEATRTVADQFYGRQWIVRMNEAFSIYDSPWLTGNKFPSTENYPVIEYSPVNAGWSQRSTAMPSGVTNHELLNDSLHPTFKDELGRLKPFVSIVNYNNKTEADFPYAVDTSLLGQNEYFIEQGPKLCLPVSVDVYEKYPLYAIVSLNQPVQGVTEGSGYADMGAFYDFLIEMGYTKQQIDRYDLINILGDNAEFGLAPPRPYRLNCVAEQQGVFFPVQFNNRNYGPFVASGSRPGPVNLRTESDYAPWTFGSYSNLNLAGEQTVNKALSTIDVADFGNLTIAGLPAYNLGANIGQNANITSISIQYGQDGLTTSYNLKTFIINPLGFSKLLSDKINKIYNTTVYNNREIINIDKKLSYADRFKTQQVNTRKEVNDAASTAASRNGNSGSGEDYGYLGGKVKTSVSGVPV